MSSEVKTLANHYKWTPKTIMKLYCDEDDEFGIVYWYNEAKRIIEAMNKK